MFIGSALGEKTVIVLGLSKANRDKLWDGWPIRVTRETHGLVVPADLVIILFGGDTEASMAEEMVKLMGPSTVVGQKKPI